MAADRILVQEEGYISRDLHISRDSRLFLKFKKVLSARLVILSSFVEDVKKDHDLCIKKLEVDVTRDFPEVLLTAFFFLKASHSI